MGHESSDGETNGDPHVGSLLTLPRNPIGNADGTY